MMIYRLFAPLLLALACSSAGAFQFAGAPGFIDEMVAKHNFQRDELERLFGRAQYQQAVIDAMTSPATLRPWPDYRVNFINEARIKAGLKFWCENEEAVRRAEQQYGVPQEIIVSLIGVETFYGKQAGTFRTVDALSTLAFSYPPRADYFRGELEQYLLLARDQGFNLLAVRGSYAGALGISQFMPSSYRKYAVDFDGNGKVDLMHERADAIGSAANYLKQYGWIPGEPMAVRARLSEDACMGDISTPRSVGEWIAAGVTPVLDDAPTLVLQQNTPARLLDFTVQDGKEFWLTFNNFDVVKAYNNSSFYAMSILQLAEALRQARGR